MRLASIMLCITALVSGCGIDAVAQPRVVSLMTFNVENLFDNVHDDGKDDLTYLPAAHKTAPAHIEQCEKIEVERWRDQCLYWDWNDDIVERKLRVVAAAILAADADVIALQEVENIRILETLRKRFLTNAGYKYSVLVEGSDARGIDVAFLSKLPLVGEPTLHPITFVDIPAERVADTRGILEATFKLPDGSMLTGFAVHFPAPYHPIEMRIQAYQALTKLRQALPADHAVFAAGDFNTISREMQQTSILTDNVRPHWQIAHELGCGDCKGTYYYARDDNWSFLDMILFAQGESRWAIVADSVRIENTTADQVTAQNTPNRFELPEGTGVTDHWPLAVDIAERR